MIKKLILVLASLVSIYYCFRFGYIWTAYGHGGQILGVPFTLLMLIIVIKYLLKKQSVGKEKLFLFAVVYFLTLAAFSVTIEVIRATKENYFAFLYYEPGGYVNKIFLAWLIIGIIACTVGFRQITNRYKLENKHRS
jgi:hypothetical protein